MLIQGSDISVIEYKGQLWCDFLLLNASLRDNWTSNIYPIINNIGKDFFYRKPDTIRKNRCRWFINSEGLTRYFSLSRSIPLPKIKECIGIFNANGFNVSLQKTSKEYEFGNDLENILNVFDVKIERQKKFSLSYGVVFVDFFINKHLCVEYDENNHLSYDKEKENQRERELKQMGFDFLRVTDKNSNTENIAIILKELKLWKQKSLCVEL